MKYWKEFVYRVRVWNTGWNPFFSSSLYSLKFGKSFLAGFKQEFEKGKQ